MAMSERHKKLLNTNRLFLIQNIHLSQEFFAHLTPDKTLTTNMQEEIEVQATRQSQVGKLLDLLPMRPARAFDRLIYALVGTHQQHVAARLDYQRTMELIAVRDNEQQSSSNSGYGGNVQPSSESKSEPSTFVPSGVTNPSVVFNQNQAALLPTGTTHSGSFHNQPAGKSCVLPSAVMGTSSQHAGTGSCQPCSNPVPSGSSGSVTGSLPTSSAVPCTSMEVSPDETDVINYLKKKEELQIFERDHLKIGTPPGGHQAVKNGLAIIICNSTLNNMELNTRISSCALTLMFEALGFETVQESDYTAQEISTLLREHASMQSSKYDAFLLMFIGFGSQDGTIYGSDGTSLSTTSEILPLFATDKCPAFNGKPKIFLFQLAQLDTNPVDIVDAKLNQPPPSDPRWSDMIIFTAVTVAAENEVTDENQSKLNLMYRALIKVTSKFVHLLPFTDILQKVRAILLCQEFKTSSCGFSIQSQEIFISPGSRPVYLQKQA